MLGFSVVGPSGNTVDLMAEAGATPVPPLAHFVAVFDRLLDPTALETIDPDGGVIRASITPNDGVAVAESNGTSIPTTTLYIPNGDYTFTLIYPKGPSITVNPTLGLPSGSPVTVALDPTKVRSHDQTKPFVAAEDAGVMSTLSFDTEPLAVSVTVPQPAPPEDDGGTNDDAGPDAGAGNSGGDDGGMAGWVAPAVATDFAVKVLFNNLTDDANKVTSGAMQVSATVAGAPVALSPPQIARDDADPAGWIISPPMDGWPPGAVVTVTIGAAAVDNFGKTLGAPVSEHFTVKP
jgi:hypothetical protein